MRFQYRHPKIYDFLINFLYSKKVMNEFAKEVGKNQSVFDVAAGYGRIAKFIHYSNSYFGIDLNEIFIKYGRKLGLNIEKKDIFNRESYRKSNVFVLVDVVHHLSKERLRHLFDIVFQHSTKKIVIIEPAFVDIAHKYGFIGKFIDWLFKKIDYDGFNEIKRWFSHKEYLELFYGKFGSRYGKIFKVKCKRVLNHYLVTFTLRQEPQVNN